MSILGSALSGAGLSSKKSLTSNALVKQTRRKVLSHNVTFLVAGLNQFYKLRNPLVFSGDYRKEFVFYFDGGKLLLDGQTDYNSRLSVFVDGSVFWRASVDQNLLTTPADTVKLNSLNVLTVERIGSQGVISLNRNEITNGSVTQSDCVTMFIGKTGHHAATGAILAAKYWDANELVAHYEISKNNWLTKSGNHSNALLNSADDSHHATAVNITDNDVEVFEEQANADLLGEKITKTFDVKSVAQNTTLANPSLEPSTAYRVTVNDSESKNYRLLGQKVTPVAGGNSAIATSNGVGILYVQGSESGDNGYSGVATYQKILEAAK